MDANQALDELLTGRLKPGVYQWRVPAGTGAVGDTGWMERAGEHGWRPFYLDGRRARDKDAFLRACADAFAFPDWFGDNWDALEDSLTDLSWAPADHGYLVLYESWAELADADQASFRTALDVFAEAVASWRDTDTPMTVLLSSVGVEVAGVPRLT
ncbi:barstar family protein [Actinomadura rupiterrae]|uniref:barstar family protein n=1 Tax=Actinomadura rupiterrae TaxID=559627 RepID=UPI0020A3FEFC|nr:barstar family protein [Actinomadura rupiterrae]MCP2340524.1 RNAse (barnase) inhibitor barstar [Actinomadura rupiterrae]